MNPKLSPHRFANQHRLLRRSRKQVGFTLIEVLLAISVLSIASLALSKTINQSTNSLERQQKIIVAVSILKEKANLYRAAPKEIPTSTKSSQYETVFGTWTLKQERQKTNSQGFFRLELSLEAENEKISNLTSYYRTYSDETIKK